MELGASSTAKHSVRTNFFFNFLQQFVTFLIPLVVAPYISRVLGVSGVGTYSYAYSILFYFVLFANFGFGYYAQREIAATQGDQRKQSLLFWELFIDRLIVTGLSLSVYLGLLAGNVIDSQNILFWILVLYLGSCPLDISFFLSGNEDFVDISLFTILIRVVGAISMFLFVKTSDDVWKYALILSLSQVFGNAILWIKLKGSLVSVKGEKLHLLRHFVPSLKLFIPTAALSLFNTMDKSMIGWLVPGMVSILENGAIKEVTLSSVENGYFEQAEKIVDLCLTLVTSFGSVMISRNSRQLALKDFKSVSQNIVFTSRLIWLIGLPVCFGIVCVSFIFVPLFFGQGYEKTIYLLYMLAPIVLLSGFSNLFGVQLLIPEKKESYYMIAILCGAAVNILSLLLLVPTLYSFGAAISALLSYVVTLFVEILLVRKEIPLKMMILSSWKYLLSSLAMFIVLFPLSLLFKPEWIYQHSVAAAFSLLGFVCFGSLLYFGLLRLLKDDFLQSAVQIFTSSFHKFKIFNKKMRASKNFSEKENMNKTPCLHFFKPIFWSRYFAPLFSVFFIFGICYSFIYIHDKFQSRGQFTVDSSVSYQLIKSVSDVAISQKAAEQTISKLDLSGIRHSNGSQILTGDVISGVYVEYYLNRTQVNISFTSTDQDITTPVLSEHMDTILNICTTEIPGLLGNIHIYFYPTSSDLLDSYRYLYIVGSAMLGCVVSVVAYCQIEKRKVNETWNADGTK